MSAQSALKVSRKGGIPPLTATTKEEEGEAGEREKKKSVTPSDQLTCTTSTARAHLRRELSTKRAQNVNKRDAHLSARNEFV